MLYEMQTEFQGSGFVAVPNEVVQSDLSAEALGVLVFIASKPNGWRFSPTDIRQRFSFGRDKWQRIAREMRAAGLIHLARSSSAEVV